MGYWPHAPLHLLKDQGLYMVTAGTFLKEHHFEAHSRRQFLQDHLLQLAVSFSWELHAWAIFSNHYHFIAHSPKDPSNLSAWIKQLHHLSALEVNRLDAMPGRKVWHQFWDNKITIQTSYLARLNYVHQNPVKHGLVVNAAEYPWCSAAQFERQANASFVKSFYSFDYKKVKVFDVY